MEVEHASLFTSVVNNVRLDETYTKVVEVFERETRQTTVWLATHQPLPGFIATSDA